jgi:hypothetical protein
MVDDGDPTAGDAIDDRPGTTYREHVDMGPAAARAALGGTPDRGAARCGSGAPGATCGRPGPRSGRTGAPD